MKNYPISEPEQARYVKRSRLFCVCLQPFIILLAYSIVAVLALTTILARHPRRYLRR